MFSKHNRGMRVATRRFLFLPAVILCAGVLLHGQTPAPLPTSTTAAGPTGPTYFSETGVRYSYYDQTLTETTNLGIRLTKIASQDVPGGLWTIVSIDATPRSQASTAAMRLGARYFLTAIGGGNLIVYANIAAGAQTSSTAAIVAGSSSTVSTSLLGNLQGGMGFVWRACHTFNKNSKVNCVADLDYELNSVSTEAVKPIVGLYVGVAF
jgi:hypothetical protein